MKKVFLLISALAISQACLAEYKSIEQANIVLVDDSSEVFIKEDGSAKIIGTRTFKANNDQGRQELALYSIPYAPDRNPTKILWAKTITDGKEIKIDLKTIKNKELPQPKGGLSKARQLIIPFTHLEAGSQISFGYEETNKVDVLPGVFSMDFIYGFRFPELAGTTKLISKKPLFAKINDPNKDLEIKEGKEGSNYTWSIKLLKPAYYLPKDEEGVTLEPKNFPMATITTAQSWSEIASPLAAKYEKVLSKALPPLYSEIANKAKVADTELEKARLIVSELATKLTYAGDWSSTERGFFPREFNEVSKTRTGDCKDFASGMTAILRSIGVKAHVAIVGRSSPQSPEYLFIREPVGGNSPNPALNLFNHAIVRIETKEGKVLWIDPTNPAAQHKAPFSDISGSWALKIESKNTTLETLPSEIDPESIVSVEKTINPRIDGTADFSASLNATGLMAANMNAMTLQAGQPAMEQLLWTLLMTKPQKQLSSSTSFSNKTRIYRPYSASVTGTISSPIVENNEAMRLVNPLPLAIMNFKLIAKDRTSAIYIGDNGLWKTTSIVRGIDIKEEHLGDCQVYSDWIDLKRRVYKIPEGLKIEDTLITKKSFIRSEDFKDGRLDNTMWKLRICAATQATAVTNLDLKNPEQLDNRHPVETNASIEKAIELINNSKSNDSQEYKALRILEAIIKKDEKNALGYAYLARVMRIDGYLQGDQYDPTYLKRSLELADKSIALNPQIARGYLERARTNLYTKNLDAVKKDFSMAYKLDPQLSSTYVLGGEIMKREGKKELAEKSYIKALSFANEKWEKKFILNRLAELSLDTNNYEKSIVYYNQVITLEPEDPWVLNNIAIAYNGLSKWDESITVLKKALSISEFGAAKSNLIDAYSGKALGFINKNPRTDQDLKQAEELAKLALKLNGDSPSALAITATVYDELSKTDGTYTMDAQEYLKRTMFTGRPPKWFFERVAKMTASQHSRATASGSAAVPVKAIYSSTPPQPSK